MKPVSKPRLAFLLALLAAVLAIAVIARRRPEVVAPFLEPVKRVIRPWRDHRAIRSAVERFGPDARSRLAPFFAQAGIPYPAKRLALLGFKEEKLLELWASDGVAWRLIREYPIFAASGRSGPKLREGDMQVPEGFYRISVLNPESSFHLSMRVNYPNEEDRERARLDGRTNLGGDIYIHGSEASIGCLAMGDRTIEELFVAVAETGMGNIEVILAPNDLRRDPPLPVADPTVTWAGPLRERLARALASFTRAREAEQPHRSTVETEF